MGKAVRIVVRLEIVDIDATDRMGSPQRPLDCVLDGGIAGKFCEGVIVEDPLDPLQREEDAIEKLRVAKRKGYEVIERIGNPIEFSGSHLFHQPDERNGAEKTVPFQALDDAEQFSLRDTQVDDNDVGRVGIDDAEHCGKVPKGKNLVPLALQADLQPLEQRGPARNDCYAKARAHRKTVSPG